jgi:hypothetical protein
LLPRKAKPDTGDYRRWNYAGVVRGMPADGNGLQGRHAWDFEPKTCFDQNLGLFALGNRHVAL